MLHEGRLKVKSAFSKQCHLVGAESGLLHIATIQMRENHECSVDFGTLFDNRFLTTLCGLEHVSGAGCGVHAQSDDLSDHYRRHFLWSNITISRLFC